MTGADAGPGRGLQQGESVAGDTFSRSTGAGSAPTAALVADPGRAGLILDFDGTLAPIVADPATSRLPDGLADVLADLARALRLVTVLSGRPAAFLADRVPLDGVARLGLYGLERWTDGGAVALESAAEWRDVVARARARLAVGVAGEPGALLEDKGLSVAVHWRTAADREGAGRRLTALSAAVAADTGLHREPGKLVEELRPPVAHDKGVAVRALAAGESLATVVFVGDDRGDLPAFAAARALGGVAVGVDHGDATPTEVRAAVDLLLPGPDGVAAWLTDLRDALRARGAARDPIGT